MRARVLSTLLVSIALAPACTGGEPVDPLPEGAFTLDTTALVTDAPAVGASWYDYDFEVHVVRPAARRYVVRVGDDDPRFAAFRVDGYYDADTAQSGIFQLSLSRYDDEAWTTPVAYRATKNVRSEGPVCLDVIDVVEVDCAGDAWHVMLRVVPLFVPEAGIVVGNPSISVRSIADHDDGGDVRVATVTGDVELTALPDPRTLALLDDGDASDFTATTWDRSRLAPELPRAGMAIGTRLAGGQVSDEGDVFFLLSPRQELLRFAASVVDDGLTVRFASSAFSSEYQAFLAFGETREVRVALPPPGRVSFVRIDDGAPLPFGTDDDARAVLSPPDEREWDLALLHVGSAVRVLVSPACAVMNHTARGGEDARALDDAIPGSTP